MTLLHPNVIPFIVISIRSYTPLHYKSFYDGVQITCHFLMDVITLLKVGKSKVTWSKTWWDELSLTISFLPPSRNLWTKTVSCHGMLSGCKSQLWPPHILSFFWILYCNFVEPLTLLICHLFWWYVFSHGDSSDVEENQHHGDAGIFQYTDWLYTRYWTRQVLLQVTTVLKKLNHLQLSSKFQNRLAWFPAFFMFRFVV